MPAWAEDDEALHGDKYYKACVAPLPQYPPATLVKACDQSGTTYANAALMESLNGTSPARMALYYLMSARAYMYAMRFYSSLHPEDNAGICERVKRAKDGFAKTDTPPEGSNFAIALQQTKMYEQIYCAQEKP